MERKGDDGEGREGREGGERGRMGERARGGDGTRWEGGRKRERERSGREERKLSTQIHSDAIPSPREVFAREVTVCIIYVQRDMRTCLTHPSIRPTF